MNSIRWTTLNGMTTITASYSGAPQEQGVTELPGGNSGIDEVVLNPSLGTLATFQEPPNLAKLLSGEGGSLGIVI